MELICNSEKVGMDESHGVGEVLFNSSAWVEYKFNPTCLLVSDVVLEWSADLSFSKIGTVNEFIK